MLRMVEYTYSDVKPSETGAFVISGNTQTGTQPLQDATSHTAERQQHLDLYRHPRCSHPRAIQVSIAGKPHDGPGNTLASMPDGPRLAEMSGLKGAPTMHPAVARWLRDAMPPRGAVGIRRQAITEYVRVAPTTHPGRSQFRQRKVTPCVTQK